MTTKDVSRFDIKVQKRNGQIVSFRSNRIRNAIANAFKEKLNLPIEVQLPKKARQDVDSILMKVLSVLKNPDPSKEYWSVEEIQDEVIHQLKSNGFAQAAELYDTYRKRQAERRSLVELYSTVKRDGNVVSFKPEKITKAIAQALCAHNEGKVTENLLKVACQLSDTVVKTIQHHWPNGRAIPLEEIQDLVQETFAAVDLHDVAKRYKEYRKAHANTRCREITEPSAVWDRSKQFTIKTITGEDKIIHWESLHQSIASCCAGIEDVSIDIILKESIKNYYDGITEDELATGNIMAAKSFLEKEPNYSFVAARLLLLKAYRESIGYDVSFHEAKSTYPSYFVSYILKGVALDLLSPDLLDFDLHMLGNHLDPQRDFLFRYMGLQTLYDRYFIHWEGQRLEWPQIFWMRVAMGVAKNEGRDRSERAIEFYDMLSTFRFIPSTPTLFNSGTNHSQLSSCFLTTIEDDLKHIFKCIQDDAMLSKWSGGLGNDWTNVRAMGAGIKGTNGKSQGIIPFLKVANDTALAVNQGGKRKGAMCAYLEIWHLDIEEFLELRKNTGDDRRRTHDMHTANWIPDLFMKRIKANANWTLFSPDDVPDLHELYGQKFDRRYEEYESMAKTRKIKFSKTVSAVSLWRKMLNMLFETGHPWLTWKDPSNIRSHQDHTGVVHCSNLCTEILLNTSRDETAVCNLGSINLAGHVDADQLNHKKIKETIHSAVRMLDNVIDVNFYPTTEAKTANQEHRPIGLGIMGFQDALFIQKVCYASPEAIQFADESMEAVSYYAVEASIELAKERGMYSSYQGSKWDRGLLPIDTIALMEQERGGHLEMDRSTKMNWTSLRENLKKIGLRNSQLLAVAPTATIANIIGVTSSIEPLYKNIFVKSNLSGEFTVVNEYLVNDLKESGLWDQEMIDDLKYFDGSIQEIQRIPEILKRRYVGAFEIAYEWLLEAASRRQKWIDMGQSLNLYQAKPSGKKVSDMYLMAWIKGLKTTYYLRSMGATRIEKSTLDITRKKYVDNIVGGRQKERQECRLTQPIPKLSVDPADECDVCQ